MSEEDYKDIGAIKNKWIETKDDYLDMALNIIDKLKQENTQLKQSLENAQNIYKNSHKYTSECEDKVIELKSVLKEIREYCNTYTRLSAKDLLEIIDKGIGEDNG